MRACAGGDALSPARWAWAIAVTLAVLLLPWQCEGQEEATPFPPTVVNADTSLGGTPAGNTSWHVPSDTVSTLVNVTGSARLTLQYLWLDTGTVQRPGTPSFPAANFSSNLLLPWVVDLAPTSSLVIRNVTVRIPCDELRQLQDQACQTLARSELIKLQILPEDLVVWRLRTAQADITRLVLTCRDSLLDAGLAPAAPPDTPLLEPEVPEVPPITSTVRAMACVVVQVSCWSQLEYLSEQLQLSSNDVHVVVTRNITIPAGVMAGDTGVYPNSRIYVHGDPFSQHITTMNLGLLNNRATWTLHDNARMTFRNLTFVTLPLGPPEKYPWSVFGWAMWMVKMERCDSQRTGLQLLQVQNCTLVMSPELMDYMSHWTAEVSSPFPDRQEAAHWYKYDETCVPTEEKSFLLEQVTLMSQKLWLAENATGFGVRFIHTLFTTQLPAGVAITFAPLQLTQLFSDPFIPLSSISWVETADRFLHELVNGTRQNIVLLQNITIPVEMWPPGGVVVQENRPLAITGWPARPTIIDWQRVPGMLRLLSPITLRNMELMNGAQDSNPVTSKGEGNLTMLQWTFNFDRSKTMLEMHSVRMILPDSEFNLLLANVQSLGTGTGSNIKTGGGSSMWAATQLVGVGEAHVDVLVENGVVAYNMSLMAQSASPPLPFPVINVTVMDLLPEDQALGPSSSASSQSWRTVLAIALPVSVVVILLAVGAYVLARRRPDDGQDSPGGIKHHLQQLFSGQRQGPEGKAGAAGGSPHGALVDASVSNSTHDGAFEHCDRLVLQANGLEDGLGALEPCRSGRAAPLKPGALAGMGRGSLDSDYLWSERTVPGSGAQVPRGPADSSRTLAFMYLAPANGTTASSASRDGPHAPLQASSQPMPQTLGAARAGSHTGPATVGAAGLPPRSTRPPTAATSVAGPASRAPGNSGPLSQHPPGSGPASGSLPASGPLSAQGWTPSGQPLTPRALRGANGLATPPGIAASNNAHSRDGLGGVGGSRCSSPAAALHGVPLSPTLPTNATLGDECVDSFDLVPEHHEQLLINRMELSRDLQASISAPDVAQQLKSMVSAMQSELGDQEVEITRVIGQGGGGVVYQGVWRGLTVAVKTLVFTVVPMQPMSRRQHRAMTEAAICKTLQHPNIINTYAYDLHALTPMVLQPGAQGTGGGEGPASTAGKSDSAGSGSRTQPSVPPAGRGSAQSNSYATEFKLYIIQEFCDGGTLKGAIDDGKLTDLSSGHPRPALVHILQLATDVAAGMSHVHSRNVVHGDLNPANVLLKTAGSTVSGWVAKVADFGLSWKLAQGQVHVSNAAQGTPMYIAPEVLHVGIMSKAADVWSFGMLLHEMYHGQPYWRTHSNAKRRAVPATAAAGAAAPRSPIQRPGLDQLAWAEDCPPDFKELVCACLSNDPQARPSFFTVVEQLLAMQRQLYAEEEVTAAAVAAEAARAFPTAPEGVLPIVVEGVPSVMSPFESALLPTPAGSAAPGIAGVFPLGPGGAHSRSMSGSGWSASRLAPRQPTSGLLQEGEVKAVYRSLRMGSGQLAWSSAEAPEPAEWEAGLKQGEDDAATEGEAGSAGSTVATTTNNNNSARSTRSTRSSARVSTGTAGVAPHTSISNS